MAAAAFKELTDQELVHNVLKAERDLVDARFKHSLNQLENTATLADLRKSIARLRTELRARELGQGLGPHSLMRQHRGSYQAAGGAEVEAAPEKGGFLAGVVDKLTGNE